MRVSINKDKLNNIGAELVKSISHDERGYAVDVFRLDGFYIVGQRKPNKQEYYNLSIRDKESYTEKTIDVSYSNGMSKILKEALNIYEEFNKKIQDGNLVTRETIESLGFKHIKSAKNVNEFFKSSTYISDKFCKDKWTINAQGEAEDSNYYHIDLLYTTAIDSLLEVTFIQATKPMDVIYYINKSIEIVRKIDDLIVNQAQYAVIITTADGRFQSIEPYSNELWNKKLEQAKTTDTDNTIAYTEGDKYYSYFDLYERITVERLTQAEVDKIFNELSLIKTY